MSTVYLKRDFDFLYMLAEIFFVSALLIGSLSIRVSSQNLDVPYVPTPQPVVDRMLEVAVVEPGDYVIDLGSGDGRIVISAAKLGATGHGVDLDPDRIKEARENARTAGVENQVMFLQQNIFDTDISKASVITMYLLSSVNLKLRPRLFEMLEPGTRVVSHSFDMGDWQPDASYTVDSSTGRGHSVYLWVIPAQAEGTWSWEIEDQSFTMDVDQQYQEIDVNLESGNGTLETGHNVLRGKRISFTADNGDNHYVYSGRIEGDELRGTIQIRSSNNNRILEWTATRK